MLPNGDFDKMEPFMEHTRFNNLIDMEVGPDGRLYLLEYGTGWFQKNPDAALSRIDYNGGNLAPKVANLQVNQTSGTLPLALSATVEASDVENDKLKYTWKIGSIKKETKEPRLEITLDKPGDYPVSVEVSDGKNTTTSEVISVYAGNAAPSVEIEILGNKTFYFPGKQVNYSVKITDPDDSNSPDLNNLVVTADYMEGSDRAGANLGHQVLTEAALGKNLMLTLDCKTCHKENEPSIGPSYLDVAKKYRNDPNAVSYLVDKIIKGGGGVWGEVAMAAHPDLKPEDARQIVTWIRSLTEEKTANQSLPASGSIDATLGKPVKDNGLLYISAVYTDRGGDNIKPLSGSTMVSLRNSQLNFRGVDSMSGFTTASFGGNRFMITPSGAPGWFVLKNIDLTDISNATLRASWLAGPTAGYTIELHLDAPDGKLLASFDVAAQPTKAPGSNPPRPTLSEFKSKFEAVTDGKFHNVYVVSKPKEKETVSIYLSQVEFR